MLYKIFTGVICVVMAFMVSGCSLFQEKYDPGSEYSTDRVILRIREEFQQQYENEEFAIEDFDWDNIFSVVYNRPLPNYDSEGNNIPIIDEKREIIIYLQEHGREQVINAIEHFNTLEFVYNAKGRPLFSLDSVSVYIKETYRQRFEDKEITINDFNWNNVESVSEIRWSSSFGSMTVTLKEHGRCEVIEAVEHFRRLKFVENSLVVGINHIN